MRRNPAVVVLLAALSPACQYALDVRGRCTTDDDCLPEERCEAERCVPGAASPDAGAPVDAGPEDSGAPDSGSPADSGPWDSGPPDAGPTDSGPADAGPTDSGPTDAGPPDAGRPDAGAPDGGAPDACVSQPPDCQPGQCGTITFTDPCNSTHEQQLTCGPCTSPEFCGAGGTPNVCSPFDGYGIWGSSYSDVWAVGASGMTLHFDGAKWQERPTGSSATLRAVWGSGLADVWAVGGQDTTGSAKPVVMVSNGTSWTDMTSALVASPEVGPLYGISGINGTGLWVVGPAASGTGGTVVDLLGGLTPVDSLQGPVYGVSADAASIQEYVWVVGATGGAWQKRFYPVATMDWVPLPFDPGTDPVPDLYGVWASSATDVWAVGANSTLIGWNGTGWDTLSRAPGTSTLRGVWVASGGAVWAVGDGGRIVHLPAWQIPEEFYPTGQDLRGIWGADWNNIWAVGDAALLHYNGGNWNAWSQ